ncbi:hypothetical protein Syun_003235 [Stephania yunnanensis]|uniref:FMN hydroxy acid dehydrogenase domain-containing protein n=1 Tax=Stephania yunnanensis TaxID=152371 RepID=A0AAP0L2C5_9MAGN
MKPLSSPVSLTVTAALSPSPPLSLTITALSLSLSPSPLSLSLSPSPLSLSLSPSPLSALSLSQLSTLILSPSLSLKSLSQTLNLCRTRPSGLPPLSAGDWSLGCPKPSPLFAVCRRLDSGESDESIVIKLVKMVEITNVSEYEAIAKERLPKMVYDYFASGAEDQWTLKENRSAFSKILFRPRILIDATNIDLTTTVLGYKISMPIMIAPTAMQKMAHPKGELATARAASTAGTIMVVLKNISRLCGTKPKVTVNKQFPGPTLYAREGDRVLVKVRIKRNQRRKSLFPSLIPLLIRNGIEDGNKNSVSDSVANQKRNQIRNS